MSKATIRLQGITQAKEGKIKNQGAVVEINGRRYKRDALSYDVPVTGTVYGALLNYRGAFDALEPVMHKAPYKTPPKEPVLYIKPENTLAGHGAGVMAPEGVTELEMGASLGVVIGKTATQVKECEAMEYIKGYTVVNDVTIPHEHFYRPAVKEKCRDGFCPIGPWIVDRRDIADPDALNIRVYINGMLKQENNTKNLIRSVEKLIEDVTGFMTLYAGDTLLVGVPENAPLAKNNDSVEVEIESVGVLENTIKNENRSSGGR